MSGKQSNDVKHSQLSVKMITMELNVASDEGKRKKNNKVNGKK